MSLVNEMGSSGIGAAELFPADMLAADKGYYQKETVGKMFSQLLEKKKAECLTKIQSGSRGPSFQIGAGSYTETEWKKLLKGFDVAQAKLREAAEETKKETQKTNSIAASDEEDDSEEKSVNELCSFTRQVCAASSTNIGGLAASEGRSMTASVEMLLAEYTTAVYPSGDKEIPDDVYYTFYAPEGIYCRKKGQSEIEWEISFEDASQYEKVMSYVHSLDSQSNLRFACHENFWQDFITDQIDMNKFNDFLETRVVDGVPDYLNVYETGVNIEPEAALYSKYMNLPDFVENMCYTSEEAFRTFFNHRKVDGNKQPGHTVINMNDLDQYYAKHPGEIGKRNHYYNGRWYSMAELMGVLCRFMSNIAMA